MSGHDKPVFFDASGKRRKIINIILAFVLVAGISSIAYIAYNVYRLNKINHLAKTVTQKPVTPNTNMTLLYSSNEAKSYGIASDQIENLDVIIQPKYLVTQSSISTPDDYQKWINDIDFISSAKPVHYERYYLMSSKNYSNPPTERNDVENSTTAIDATLPRLATLSQTIAIRDDASAQGAKGLYVEIDLMGITQDGTISELRNWLIGFKQLLAEKQITLGVVLTADSLGSKHRSIIDAVDNVYLRISHTKTHSVQLSQLHSMQEVLTGKEVTFEIPTVSYETNRWQIGAYKTSKAYHAVEPLLRDMQISNRANESITIDKGAVRTVINDAVTANNIIRSLEASKLINESTHFSIANPGFEEYTTWRLIRNPLDTIRNVYLLSEEMLPSLDIKNIGEGKVMSLVESGTPGRRSIDIAENNLVTNSKILKEQAAPIVQKSGKLPKKIALTFDDGPHPEHTIEVLDILDRYNVKGTFFVVGQNVIANPSTAKEIVARGHEIENHTFDHPVFSKLTNDSQVNQIKANTQIIESITGQKVQFFRKPYSDNTSITTEQDINYLNSLRSLGLRASEYDIDSKDWLLDSTDAVVNRVITELQNSKGDYSQILFHDTHNEIDRTLEALPRVIEYLKSQNIEIVRVDEMVSAAPMVHNNKTTNTYRAIDLKEKLFLGILWINLSLVFLSLLKYIWVLAGAIMYQIKHRARIAFLRRINSNQRSLPQLGIIIACYNEEKVIGSTLDGLLNSTYQRFTILVVNDGSTDKTEQIVQSYAEKDSRIKLLSIPNGGKAKALEAGIAQMKNKWLVFCDADTIFAPDALYGFADSILTNNRVGAVAGRINVGNQTNMLTRAQAIEYGISHIFMKSAQDLINSITVVPGALGLWNRKSLVEIGGFKSDTLAEDADTTMRLISKRKRVKYFSTIQAKTEAPEGLKMLYKQRTRWQLGNMQAMIKHSRGLFRPRYGALGFFGLPMFAHELLTILFYPIIVVFTAIIALSRAFDWQVVVPQGVSFTTESWFIAMAVLLIGIELALSIIVIISEKTTLYGKLKLLLTLPYFIVFYKTFLSYSTLVAFLRAARGTLQGWGHLTRTASVK